MNDQQNKSDTIVSPTKHKKIHFLAILSSVSIILALVALVFLYMQQNRITSLNGMAASLQATNAQLKSDKSDLSAKNNNLQESVKTLQEQLSTAIAANASAPISSTTTDTSLTADIPRAAGSLVINSVLDEPADSFSTPGEIALSGTVRAISVTITNLTNTNQQYLSGDFTATTDSGIVLTPRVYPGPAGQKVWNNSQLAPNGHQTVTLLFGIDSNLVTLSWKVPGGSSPIVVSLPTPQK